MVQAWVAHFVTPLTYTYDKYNQWVMSQKLHKKLKQHDNQHHHGVGAARPSSDVDLMTHTAWGVGGLGLGLLHVRYKAAGEAISNREMI